MTKQEFLSIAYWKQEYILEANYFSYFLEQDIVLQILFNQFDTNREISNTAIHSLNDFIQLSNTHLEWIKKELWRNCDFNLKTSSHGIAGIPKKENQSELEANQDYFGIYEEDQAYYAAKAKSITASNDTDIEPNTCFWIEFEVPWNYENKITFVFINGYPHRVE